jgi:acetolactate synthase-1/3 small subunit
VAGSKTGWYREQLAPEKGRLLLTGRGEASAVEFQLTAWMDQEPGVLDRALAALSRRRIRIGHLVTASGPEPGTMVAVVRFDCSPEDARRAAHQIGRGVQVLGVQLAAVDQAVQRELALVRVRTAPHERPARMAAAEYHRADVVAVDETTVTLAFTGGPEDVNRFVNTLQAWGIESMTRVAACLATPTVQIGWMPGPAENREEFASWPPSTMTATPSQPSSGNAR